MRMLAPDPTIHRRLEHPSLAARAPSRATKVPARHALSGCFHPRSDLRIDLVPAEQIQVVHAVGDPLARLGKRQGEACFPVSTEGTGQGHDTVTEQAVTQ